MHDETRALTEAEREVLLAIRYRRPLGSMRDEIRRLRVKRAGLAVRMDEHPWTWALTAAGYQALARATGEGT